MPVAHRRRQPRRGGMAGLERTLSRKLADVVNVLHTVRTSAALLDGSTSGSGASGGTSVNWAEEAEPSPFLR